MKKLLAIAVVFGAAGLGANFLIGAPNTIGSCPAFSSTTDQGKSCTVGPSGTLTWLPPGGVSGATGATNDLVAFGNGTATKLIDTGIPSANVVLVSRQVIAGTGVTVTPQQQLTSDITVAVSPTINQSEVITGALGVSGFVTAPSGMIGTTTNNNACTGCVGEQLGPITRARGSGTSLTTSTPVNIGTTTSLTLTAGDWEVRAFCDFLPAASTTITELDCAISKTSATLPSSAVLANPAAGEVWMTVGFNALVVGSNDWTMSVPPYRVTVANGATMPLFHIGRAVFGVSTLAVSGFMDVRRIR